MAATPGEFIHENYPLFSALIRGLPENARQQAIRWMLGQVLGQHEIVAWYDNENSFQAAIRYAETTLARWPRQAFLLGSGYALYIRWTAKSEQERNTALEVLKNGCTQVVATEK